MRTKIGRGLLALLVCVCSLSVPKGYMARKTTLMSATVTACCPVSGFRVR